MTASERSELGVLMDFLTQWRDEDTDWKLRAETRLTALEGRNIAADAVKQVTTTITTTRRETARWRLGLAVAALSVFGGAITALVTKALHP